MKRRYFTLVCCGVLVALATVAQAQGMHRMDGHPPSMHGMHGDDGDVRGAFGTTQGQQIAHRVRQLIALEQIVQLGLTAPEIDRVVPICQDISVGQGQLESKVNTCLDATEQKLLATPPGQSPSLAMLDQMRSAASEFRTRQDADQVRLETALGNDRADRLLNLVGIGKPAPPAGQSPPPTAQNPQSNTPNTFQQGGMGQRVTIDELIVLLQKRGDALRKTGTSSTP